MEEQKYWTIRTREFLDGEWTEWRLNSNYIETVDECKSTVLDVVRDWLDTMWLGNANPTMWCPQDNIIEFEDFKTHNEHWQLKWDYEENQD